MARSEWTTDSRDSAAGICRDVQFSFERSFRSAVCNASPQIKKGEAISRSPFIRACARFLRQSFDVYIKLKASCLLNAKQESHVETRAVRKGCRERYCACRKRRIEATTVWLCRRLLQSRSVDSDVACAAAAWWTIDCHHHGIRSSWPQIRDAARRRKRRQINHTKTQAGNISASVVRDGLADVQRTERRVLWWIGSKVANAIRRRG